MALATHISGAPGRQQFLKDIGRELDSAHRALTITGHTGDQFEAGENTAVREALIIELREKYGTVVVYNAATCNVHIESDETQEFTFTALCDSQSTCVTCPKEGRNIVEDLIKPEVHKPHGPYDQAFFRFAGSAVRSAQEQLCMVIDHANVLLPPPKSGQMPAHEATGLNSPQLFDLHQQIMSDTRERSLVLIDHSEGLDGVVCQEIPSASVPMPDKKETSALLPTGMTGKRKAEMLAQGARIRQLRDLVEHTEKDDLLEALQAFKTREIEAQTGGLVSGMVRSMPDKMIALSPEERKWFEHFAKMLQKGSKLVPAGLLLLGPPGTGKSYRAEFLASLMGLPCLKLKDAGSESYVGVKLKKWQTVIQTAIAHKPCVLFVDEIDKQLPRTEGGGGSAADNDMAEVTAYLQTMIGSAELEGVIIVGACNNVERMNEAMVRSGRFGARAAILPPETDEQRLAVLRAVYAQVEELEGMLDDEALAIIATQTEGATGADYMQLLKLAGMDFGLGRGKTLLDAVRLHIDKCPPKRSASFQQMQDTAVEQATISFEPPDTVPVGPASEALDAYVLLDAERQKLQAQEKAAEAALAALQQKEEGLLQHGEAIEELMQRVAAGEEALREALEEIAAEVADEFGDAADATLRKLKAARARLQEKVFEAEEAKAALDKAAKAAKKKEAGLVSATTEAGQTHAKLSEVVTNAANSDVITAAVDQRFALLPKPMHFPPIGPYCAQMDIALPRILEKKPHVPRLQFMREVFMGIEKGHWKKGAWMPINKSDKNDIPADSVIAVVLQDPPEHCAGVLRPDNVAYGKPVPFYVHGYSPGGQLVCSFANAGADSHAFILTAKHIIVGIAPWEKHQGDLRVKGRFHGHDWIKLGDACSRYSFCQDPLAQSTSDYPFSEIYCYPKLDLVDLKDGIAVAECKRGAKRGIQAGDLFTTKHSYDDKEVWYCDGFANDPFGNNAAIGTFVEDHSEYRASQAISPGGIKWFDPKDIIRCKARKPNRWGDYDPEDLPFNVRDPYRVVRSQYRHIQEAQRSRTGGGW